MTLSIITSEFLSFLCATGEHCPRTRRQHSKGVSQRPAATSPAVGDRGRLHGYCSITSKSRHGFRPEPLFRPIGMTGESLTRYAIKVINRRPTQKHDCITELFFGYCLCLHGCFFTQQVFWPGRLVPTGISIRVHIYPQLEVAVC